MTIVGLWEFARKRAPNFKKMTTLDALEKGPIAIDASSVMCASLSTQGADASKIITSMKIMAKKLMLSGFQPVFVFDGHERLAEKKLTADGRSKRKHMASERLADITQRYEEAKTKAGISTGTASATGSSSSSSASASSSGSDGETIDLKDMEEALKKGDNCRLNLSFLKRQSDRPTKRARTDKSDTEKSESDSTGDTNSSYRQILAALNDEPDDDNKDGAASAAAAEKKGPLAGVLQPRETDDKYMRQVLAEGNFEAKMISLDKQKRRMDRDMSEGIRLELMKDGFLCLQSESEADFVLAHLSRQGLVKYVMADDGDLFVFGVRTLLRKVKDHLYDKSTPLEVYSLDDLLKGLRFKKQAQFVSMCVLAKSDYTPRGVKGVACAGAHDAILQYGSIDRFLKKGGTKKKPLEYDDDFPVKAKAAVELFTRPKSQDFLFTIVEPRKAHPAFESSRVRHLVVEFLVEPVD